MIMLPIICQKPTGVVTSVMSVMHYRRDKIRSVTFVMHCRLEGLPASLRNPLKPLIYITVSKSFILDLSYSTTKNASGCFKFFLKVFYNLHPFYKLIIVLKKLYHCFEIKRKIGQFCTLNWIPSNVFVFEKPPKPPK